MMGAEGAVDGNRWSDDILLPAVQGATMSAGTAPMAGHEEDRRDEIRDGYFDNDSDEEDEEGEREEEECEEGSLRSFQSHASFASMPSYMRSKSGLEMDADRYRRRKQMISQLPEAESAKRRMQQVATLWDPKKNTPLLGFDCVSLGPTQFKELFRRNFGVLLHPRDLGILVSLYDKRGEGRADSSEFLKDFWQIGRAGRELQARRRVQMVQYLKAKQNRRVRERAERRSRLAEVPVGKYTDDHVRSAVSKITEVAERYVVSREQGFHQLEQGGVMGPTMFREQLRAIFGLRLTRAEVGGLVSAFGLYRDGMVDAKEFACRFHALGRDSHAAKAAEGHARNESARRKKQEQEDKLVAKLKEHSKCKVNWNFSEEELERGKKLIAKAASTYDKARLGADVDKLCQTKLDPTAFRAQLLMNFRVRLGPGELGAVFTAFDKDNSKLIDGSELMHEFFRMGREERAKNLADAERQRQRADMKEYRFRKKLEDRFIEQTEAKVVWPTLEFDPFDDDYSLEDQGSDSRAMAASIPVAGSRITTPTAITRAASLEVVNKGDRRLQGSMDNGGTSGRNRSEEASRRTRPKPKISASTAEFLALIKKEEMAIRAMSCRGRRRRRRDGGRLNYSSFNRSYDNINDNSYDKNYENDIDGDHNNNGNTNSNANNSSTNTNTNTNTNNQNSNSEGEEYRPATSFSHHHGGSRITTAAGTRPRPSRSSSSSQPAANIVTNDGGNDGGHDGGHHHTGGGSSGGGGAVTSRGAQALGGDGSATNVGQQRCVAGPERSSFSSSLSSSPSPVVRTDAKSHTEPGMRDYSKRKSSGDVRPETVDVAHPPSSGALTAGAVAGADDTDRLDTTGTFRGSLASRSGSWGGGSVFGTGSSMGGTSMRRRGESESGLRFSGSSSSGGRVSTAASVSTARGSTARTSRGSGGGSRSSLSFPITRRVSEGSTASGWTQSISEHGGGGGGGGGGDGVDVGLGTTHDVEEKTC